jgi:uncharacterized membrane protein
MNEATCEICKKNFSMNNLIPVPLFRKGFMETVLKKYPTINLEGFVCHPDFDKLNSYHYSIVLEREMGELTDLEREVLQSLQDHTPLSENIAEEYAEKMTIGEKLADMIAEFGGSWKFIILFITIILVWMLVNTFFIYFNVFDPYPFILLNLFLSCLAAMQAPVIMMSQNRQSAKDRLKMESDYQINLKSELQIRHINARLNHLMNFCWRHFNQIKENHEDMFEDLDFLKKFKGESSEKP